jgi:hypothetical protein
MVDRWTSGCRGREGALISLDQLEVIDAARQRKPTKEDRDRDLDYARAMGVRAASMEFHLVSLLRYYTLEDVIEYWWKAQTTD